MKDKSSYNSEKTVKKAFEDLLETYQLKKKFSETQIVSAWARLMGDTIAKRTTRAFIKDKTLFVELNSAPLKHELSNSKDKVMEIFDKEFGSGIIDQVVFI